MITALCFVPKGAARCEPRRDEPSSRELAELEAAALASGALDENADAPDDGNEDTVVAGSSDEDSAGGDDGDASVDDGAAEAAARARSVAARIKSGANGKRESEGPQRAQGGHLEAAFSALDMEHYDDEATDLITRIMEAGRREAEGDDVAVSGSGGSEDSDAERVRGTDLLVLAARAEEDAATLEVWLAAEEDGGGDGGGRRETVAYVHHDLMLPAFPLAVAWTDCVPGCARDGSRGSSAERGSFAAVGTVEADVEVWDLDVVDAMAPVATLGCGGGRTKKKESKKKGRAAHAADRADAGHTDSVLALAWNRVVRNALASGSADATIRVWDLATLACQRTLREAHSGKVQALAWHPSEAPMLLSAGFDRRVCLSDARAPGSAAPVWPLPGDAEALAWAPLAPTVFAASSDDGAVCAVDTRRGAGAGAVLWTLAAHGKATTALAFHATVPGFLATASVDKLVKVWDVATGEAPRCAVARDLGVGTVFALGLPADTPALAVAGGGKGVLAFWDLAGDPDIRAAFPALA